MKIVNIEELNNILAEKRNGANKPVVVQCHGVFDLVHPGHVKHLEIAKELGDILVVTITSDRYVNKGPGRPVFNQHLRAETLAKNEDINYVVINDHLTAIEAINVIKPDIYVKGKEYENDNEDITGEIINERQAVEANGGRVHYTGGITFSSTSILNNFFGIFSDTIHEYIEQFKKKYDASSVIEALQKLSELKVLVIGDAIIDQYCYCNSMGRSPKESIIPAKYVSEEMFAGGVLAAANHLAGFCNKIHLVTCLGSTNSCIDFINTKLKTNILPKFFYYNGASTIIKRRFVEQSFLRKLFEICYLDDKLISDSMNNDIYKYLDNNISDFDLVLITDYGHGMMTPDIIKLVCEKSKFLAVNAQTNSANVGYNLITRYPKMDYMCIDDTEIRLACQDKLSTLKELMSNLRKLGYRYASVTHSKYGTITYDSDKGFFETPAFSSSVVDTMGAGDAFLSITSPLVANGNSMDLVGFVGNAVGALKVQIVGNKESIEPIPLFKFITTLLK